MPPDQTVPPFRAGGCVALAYVTGHYTPPSRRHGPYSEAFFGLYVAKDDPRLSFWTFSRETSTRLAFSVATTVHLNVEHALIAGLLRYEVPLDQWRVYPIATTESSVLESLGLRGDYDEARERLAAVLWMARMDTYISLPERTPLFTITPRSADEIFNDVAEREEVMNIMGMRW